MRKKVNIFFIFCVCIVLLMPIMFFNWKPDQISIAENRALVSAPPINEIIMNPKNYMTQLNSFINDRFGLREYILQTYHDITIGLLKGRPNDVLIGKGGWLFSEEELACYTGTEISEARLDYCVDILSEIQSWCAERNIKFIFAVGPNKSTIYPEYIPSYIKKADKTFMDRLQEKLPHDVVLIYPREALLEAKTDFEIYQKLDTHWNPYGAIVMMKEITERLGLPDKDIPMTYAEIDTGDLKTKLGVRSYEGVSLNPIVKTNNNSSVYWTQGTDYYVDSPGYPSMICFRDSYFIAMQEILTYYFSGPMHWSAEIDFEEVEVARPQYLILESVERFAVATIEKNASIFQLNANVA